ncbi:MAG: hypothetical protein E6G92_00885 [Alphaproteobacteria bacterium]|nr:MAG: hypothetical protein E6G92_00885 [Alphaproteobacteria bacterium]
MNERQIKILTGSRADSRILVMQRADGNYSYRLQLNDGVSWGQHGPDCGIYESAESAETEARARTDWLS